MDLNEVRTFVRVVQAGSFSRAAGQLGMPNSTVSAKVSSLERRLGVTLLQRTTRKLRLTEAGEAYFRECVQGLEAIQRAEAEVSSTQLEPQGLLRVTCPKDMSGAGLVSIVTRLNKKYPKLALEFLFTDRFVDLVAEGVDVAVRAGELGDSGLIARKAGSSCWVPFASPAYLKRAGTPAHPKELREHSCIQFSPLGEGAWQLSKGKQTLTVPLSQRILGNDINLIRALAVEGIGIALLPTYVAQSELSAGRLVRVLPEWRAALDPIHLVYPEQKHMPPKLRAFLDEALAVGFGTT